VVILLVEIFPIMPATIQRENDNTYVLRLSGEVQRSEFDNAQDKTAGEIDRGVKPRILAILENFEGWEKSVAWGNLDFLYWHSNEIVKIAIVGEARFEQTALAFAGAGFRNAPVKFFPDSQLAEARAWLAE
jgi:SpoIIAA-like